jgi:hypothetical protein
MRYFMGVMAALRTPEADRLAVELAKRLGDRSFTARELAEELVAADSPAELIGAFDDALARAATAEEQALDEKLWGPAPTADELARARRVAQRAQRDALAGVLEETLSRQEAAATLGISPQAVSKRHAAGSLVALSRGRELHFPGWQFSDGAAVPGLTDVITAYPGSPLALSTWANTPNPDLDRATPAQMLTRRGGVERVLEAIESISPTAW